MLNWTEISKPNSESSYTHTKCLTPIGTAIIEWKEWKEHPDYDLAIGNEWIGFAYTLEDAKNLLITHLKNLNKELTQFLQ